MASCCTPTTEISIAASSAVRRPWRSPRCVGTSANSPSTPMVEVLPPNLPPQAFRRYDESPDAFFYRQPRLVVHIDDTAIEAVTRLYRELFPPGGTILDLMSSWVSRSRRTSRTP